MTCNHPIGQQTIGQCRACHDITALGQHTRSDYVRRRMTSPPLYSTHDRMTSGVACHHRLWTPHTVKRSRVWHSIIALWAVHTVELRQEWHAIIAFGKHKKMNDVRRGMQTSPLGSTHGQTTSGVACHHRLWTPQTVKRRRACHSIISFGHHTRSNYVGCGKP